MSKNTFLEDDSSTAKPAGWDMGTGEGEDQPQPAPVPGASSWRRTATPTPASTHGIQDAAGVLPDSAKAPQGGNRFGGNMPDVWMYDTEPFPDDVQKCWAEVRKIDAYYFSNARSAAATTECFRRRRLVGAKITELSNGPKAPEMTSDVIAKMQKAQHERPAAINSRLVELEAYLATPIAAVAALDMDAESSDAEARNKLSQSPKLRIILHPVVTQWVRIAKRLACRAELFALENFDILNPTEHVQMHERELRNCSDPVRIRELKTEIARAKEIGGNRSAELALKGQAAQKWEPVFNALRSAITVSEWLVSSWGLKAILAEQDFFTSFALDWHQTSLSKQFTDFGDQLSKLNVSKSTFAFFGENDIAAADD